MSSSPPSWHGPPFDAWQALQPSQVQQLLAKSQVPWCIVGGWAIELWLKSCGHKQTRSHADLEIAIPRDYFSTIRRSLDAYQIHVIDDGTSVVLPIDQEPGAQSHQNWLLDQKTNKWRMDIMLEPGDLNLWVFRRNESISIERTKIIGYKGNIPFLKPEAVLLYKAKAQRQKDEADFKHCLPTMSENAKNWLANALKIEHPGHPWIDRLA